MGTVTYPKGKSSAKQLQVSSQEFPSYLKQDGNTKQVYGRGTGRDAAVETLELPPTRPPGHNTIGTGNDCGTTDLKR